MTARRQVDLDGAITACDASGHTLRINCEGAQLTVDADSLRAAWSAFSTLRASGLVDMFDDRFDERALEKLNDFRIELCVRGKRVGRAGSGIRASRLARIVTKIPLELNFLALLKAGVTAL